MCYLFNLLYKSMYYYLVPCMKSEHHIYSEYKFIYIYIYIHICIYTYILFHISYTYILLHISDTHIHIYSWRSSLGTLCWTSLSGMPTTTWTNARTDSQRCTRPQHDSWNRHDSLRGSARTCGSARQENSLRYKWVQTC